AGAQERRAAAARALREVAHRTARARAFAPEQGRARLSPCTRRAARRAAQMARARYRSRRIARRSARAARRRPAGAGGGARAPRRARIGWRAGIQWFSRARAAVDRASALAAARRGARHIRVARARAGASQGAEAWPTHRLAGAARTSRAAYPGEALALRV